MIFLKLGGSLITDKVDTEQARYEVIRRIAQEIYQARSALPRLKLLIGHGSGSFGHRAAQQHGTHLGAQTAGDWQGFTQVWAAANRLHRIFIDAMREAGLPALSFPPSSSVITVDGQIVELAEQPIRAALENGLLPIVYGDVAFDRVQGSSIVSTEQVLAFLAKDLHPDRLLLAGKAPGVLSASGAVLPELDAEKLAEIRFYEPDGSDVTGGMAAKVKQAHELASESPDLEILIFGAEQPGTLRDVLLGGSSGTRILGA
jgi:isopentenyl phosphate kinase